MILCVLPSKTKAKVAIVVADTDADADADTGVDVIETIGRCKCRRVFLYLFIEVCHSDHIQRWYSQCAR